MNPEQLSETAIAAFASERLTGVPAELILAQWALESAWGEHAPGSNPFGIKAYPGCPDRQLLQTKEWFTEPMLSAFLAKNDGRTATLVSDEIRGGRKQYWVRDWFAKFPSLKAAFTKHGLLLSSGWYAPAFQRYTNSGHLEEYVRSVSDKYATAPGYADQLLTLIRQQNIQGALKVARGGSTSESVNV